MSKHGTWRRLKRFKITAWYEDADGCETESPEGEWVRFEDARKLIEELEDDIQDCVWEAMGDAL